MNALQAYITSYFCLNVMFPIHTFSRILLYSYAEIENNLVQPVLDPQHLSRSRVISVRYEATVSPSKEKNSNGSMRLSPVSETFGDYISKFSQISK